MKFKPLTKEQLVISLDRLTRFKNTKEKYQRVFSDIITSNLIEPKIKKNDILTLPVQTLVNYVTTIFNHSLDNTTENFVINDILTSYENSLFNNDSETQEYLNNKINYRELLKFVNEDVCTNLMWLKSLLSLKTNLVENRERYNLKYPIEKVILVEGVTEETLLPAFSKFLNFDFYKKGIHIIGAGGKNQVVKAYYKLSQELKVPIFVLLDRDAKENIEQIQPKLRKQDKIHLVSCGEFEDILPKTLIIKTVNKHFKNFLQITATDLNSPLPTAKVLEELFKTKGLHEFKKADFAKLVKENISDKDDISEEITRIVQEIASIDK